MYSVAGLQLGSFLQIFWPPSTAIQVFGTLCAICGEGIDVCGRWDLDSPCVRRLFASGKSSIPMSWKHPFCHTSAQAVCDFINALFSYPYSPDINLERGIFFRQCRLWKRAQTAATEQSRHGCILLPGELRSAGRDSFWGHCGPRLHAYAQR